MPRKILFYTHAFGGGGAEVVFARLAEAFSRAGDDVIFAADFDGLQPVEDRVHLRHVRLRDGHVAATRHLAALLRQERPDASFSALGAQNLKHLAAALLARCTGRCILGYHGFADAEPKRLSRLSFWATPLTTRVAARTVCVSDALLADVRGHWRASVDRTVRIYNPLPPGRSNDPHGVSVRDAPPMVLACGRLAPIKRFTDLVRAFAGVPPADARLVILGEGPERDAIMTEATRHGVAERLDMPGHVADPWPWYRRASCLAITSESESFGLTAAEALACGTSVVTTDCGGPPEILDHGRYGRIVPVGDIGALTKALAETIAAPNASPAGQTRAQAFSIEAIHRAYADLIDSLA